MSMWRQYIVLRDQSGRTGTGICQIVLHTPGLQCFGKPFEDTKRIVHPYIYGMETG